MELQELIAEFRSQVSDEAPPYLWSDPEVLNYIIDAQDMFTRLTGGIHEAGAAGFGSGTPGLDLCTLTLTASQPWSVHSPHILRIRSGRLMTAKRDVKFISESGLSIAGTESYGQHIPYTFDDTDIGTVEVGVLGVQKNYVRWFRVPSANDTCRLHIMRLPYPRITTQDNDLEIDVQHHRHLIPWMKHLAYSKQDAEARDDKQAAESKQAFEMYCNQASREMERQRYKPRVVQYGGL
jgi:hypothetical protein